jgi:hypothetical protein
MSAIVPNQNSLVAEDPEVIRQARAALIARLANVVDLTTLAAGDDEFDYYVNVPASQYHELSQRIGDVEYDINIEFGVWVRAFPIPVSK